MKIIGSRLGIESEKKGTTMTWIPRWLQGVGDIYGKWENLERNWVWGKMVKINMLNLSLCLSYK